MYAQALLNDVWKVVAKFEDPKDYIAVAEVWIEYPLKHCTVRLSACAHVHASALINGPKHVYDVGNSRTRRTG
jgi:hypothetical protein